MGAGIAPQIALGDLPDEGASEVRPLPCLNSNRDQFGMAFREELEHTGNYLFRFRSYLPLVLVLLFIAAFNYYQVPQNKKWDFICLTISFVGLGIRIVTVASVPKETSGRNTQDQKADSLNTTGMYSLVRHPLYLGNFIIWLGLSLFLRLWWFTLLISLIFCLYYERIIFAEEEFLRRKFGSEFLSWTDKIPAFFPKLRNWQRPNFPFSIKTALRKEYHGFFAIISSFTFLDLLRNIFLYRQINLSQTWIFIFLAGLLTYVSIRIIAKKTDLLKVEGR